MRLAQVVVAAELVVKGKKQQCVNAAYGTGGGGNLLYRGQI